MNPNQFLSSAIIIVGTSIVGITYALPCNVGNQTYLPSSSYIKTKMLEQKNSDNYSLKNEFYPDSPSEEPIPIPVVGRMKFKFSKPELLSFSI